MSFSIGSCERVLRSDSRAIRPLREQRFDGLPLECERTGISLIVNQQVDGGIPHRRGAIARSIGDGAVADLEQPFEFTAQGRSPRCPSGAQSPLDRNCNRSRRRAIIMSRHPSSCVMSSSANPASATSESSRRSSVSRESRRAASSRRNSRCKTVSARQFSAERLLRACAAHSPSRPISPLSENGFSASNTPAAPNSLQISMACGQKGRLCRKPRRCAQQPRLVLAALGVAAHPE